MPAHRTRGSEGCVGAHLASTRKQRSWPSCRDPICSQPRTCCQLRVAEHPLCQPEARLPLVAAGAALQQIERDVEGQQAVPRIAGRDRQRRQQPGLAILLPLLLAVQLLPPMLLLLLAALHRLPVQHAHTVPGGGGGLSCRGIAVQLVAPARLRLRGG